MSQNTAHTPTHKPKNRDHVALPLIRRGLLPVSEWPQTSSDYPPVNNQLDYRQSFFTGIENKPITEHDREVFRAAINLMELRHNTRNSTTKSIDQSLISNATSKPTTGKNVQMNGGNIFSKGQKDGKKMRPVLPKKMRQKGGDDTENLLEWQNGARVGEQYYMVCIWQGKQVENSQIPGFQEWLRTIFHNAHPVSIIGHVKTLPGAGGPGGREDFLFLIHDEDVLKFSIPLRLHIGIRWWDDIFFNNQHIIYPRDFVCTFPFGLDITRPGSPSSSPMPSPMPLPRQRRRGGAATRKAVLQQSSRKSVRNDTVSKFRKRDG